MVSVIEHNLKAGVITTARKNMIFFFQSPFLKLTIHTEARGKLKCEFTIQIQGYSFSSTPVKYQGGAIKGSKARSSETVTH